MKAKLSSLALAILSYVASSVCAQDPLPSWNDTASKKAIVNFVERVTKDDSAYFVRPEERIATFDNDGTLWAEQPIYFQVFYTRERVKALLPEHPEWKDKEPFASLLKGDMKAVARMENAIPKLMVATHTGMLTDELNELVLNWITTAKHPTTGRPFVDMTYQPMVELLRYLRSNGFKTYIVSGGDVEFMRTWVEKAYGIPPEQVVGSSEKLEFGLRDGKPAMFRLPQVDFADNFAGKALGIQKFIGRRPILAFGNSDGDQQMLEWTAAGKGARFMALVHHDDDKREWAYDRKSDVGRLDKAWDEAVEKGWTVVSMKDDWKTIFAREGQ
jgi:phosphoglycolate phosphatase-like HAD superfamily hydrolase